MLSGDTGDNNMDNNAQYQGQEANHEEMPPPLMAGGRSDTINSSTVFASLSEIQPHNSYRYTGQNINIMPDQQHHQDEISLDDLPSDIVNTAQQIIANPNEIITSSGSSGIKRPHEDDSLSQSDIQQCKVIVVGSSGDTREYHETYETDPFEIPLGGCAETVTTSLRTSAATLTKLPETRDIKPRDMIRATSTNPGVDDYLGHHSFDVNFTKYTTISKNKHWDYSSKLKKLYIDMNKWVQVEFRVMTNAPSNLFIRAMPIYSDAANIREAVKRCPNHASVNDQTNIDFPQHLTKHLIRVDGDQCHYECDDSSGRLSVIFPVQRPHEGTDRTRELIKFMCLGSCIGGINRRPLKVIFTLETDQGKVVGRKVFDVRICSCPRRDKAQEEERHQKIEDKAKYIGDKVAASTMVVNLMPPPGKKLIKKESKGSYIMIPVYVDDFKNMNDMAESILIAREVQKDPANAEAIIKNIKEQRRQLMIEHNPTLIQETRKKPKPN